MASYIPEGLRLIEFEKPVWNLIYNKGRNSFFIVERSEEVQFIQLWEVGMHAGGKVKVFDSQNWWEHLVSSEGDYIYSILYEEKGDPSKYQVFRYNLVNNKREEFKEAPDFLPNRIDEPMLYEYDTQYHKMVCEFLGLSLPLSCEYLEKEDYIIISYYLRSKDGFDRYLLVIEDGEKLWKMEQDRGLKGFASGSFFVIKNQLIFVRNQNEICFYTL